MYTTNNVSFKHENFWYSDNQEGFIFLIYLYSKLQALKEENTDTFIIVKPLGRG